MQGRMVDSTGKVLDGNKRTPELAFNIKAHRQVEVKKFEQLQQEEEKQKPPEQNPYFDPNLAVKPADVWPRDIA